MPIQHLKEILQDQAPIFQYTNFKYSQKYQVTIIYYSEHTNHKIFLNFVNFKIFTNSLCMRAICTNKIVHF